MKIEQILIQPIGQRFNAGTLTIKTCKKKWQTKGHNLASADIWWQQVIFMDETGEMPADIKLGRYLPLNGKTEVNIIVAEVQNAEYLGKDRKKLVVDQHSLPTMTIDDYNSQEDEWFTAQQDQIKGKIRHGITCSYIKAGAIRPQEKLCKIWKERINDLVDFIMTGE